MDDLAVVFKAKVQKVYNMDDTLAYEFVKLPKLSRSHVDMHKFRMSNQFGGYANSDLFIGLLGRAVTKAGVKEIIKLNELPPSVSVDASGFLAEVTIKVDGF